MPKGPLLGSKSFWEMAELAIEGKLASCQSCVEFFYFQSEENARSFLDSCATGGLVDKLSLLDLRADMEPISPYGLTERQRWYDQDIYISAPAFRKHNLDAARHRVEGTKNAVYEAFHLYYEVLKGNDAAIEKAYLRAIEKGQLRNSETAAERLDVHLSVVAKLRLIKDGYRALLKKQDPERSPSEIETTATENTADFVRESADCETSAGRPTSDHAEELDQFVFEFLGDVKDLAPFWQNGNSLKSRLLVLPVISELIRRRLTSLRQDNYPQAETFERNVRAALWAAVQRERVSDVYVTALSEVAEDLDSLVTGLSASLLAPQQYGTELRP